jgi:hypothetical protein
MASCPFRGNERHVTGESFDVSCATAAVGGVSPVSSMACVEQKRRGIFFTVDGVNLVKFKFKIVMAAVAKTIVMSK